MASKRTTVVARLQNTGIRRSGGPRAGFRYAERGGGALGRRDRARIAALRVPPAWTRVAISPSPTARVQAVGRDAAGRWQYLYHPTHVRRRERAKFDRVIAFGRALPRLRRTVAADLAVAGLGRATVLACIARILATSFLRPGSEEYADENGSYGLATLRRRHVEVRGSVVRFDFPGKSGQIQQREVRDARVARIVARLLDLPGRRVFQFVADDGAIVAVRRAHVNAYLKSAMGRRFSAKDFRTWAGTLICACALAAAARADEAESTAAQDARAAAPSASRAARDRALRKRLASAVRTTAEHLGNTPAVCRASYISPAVTDGFRAGRVLAARFSSIEEILARDVAGLRRCERALLALLGDGEGAKPRRRSQVAAGRRAA